MLAAGVFVSSAADEVNAGADHRLYIKDGL